MDRQRSSTRSTARGKHLTDGWVEGRARGDRRTDADGKTDVINAQLHRLPLKRLRTSRCGNDQRLMQYLITTGRYKTEYTAVTETRRAISPKCASLLESRPGPAAVHQ